MKYRAALIVDNLHITKWQQNALDEAADNIEIVLIINCQNTRSKNMPSLCRPFIYKICI
jgi:hypothetical protein